MAENFGASFSIDTSNLKAGLNEANRLIRQSESEFRAAAAGLDDWTKSEEGLLARSKTLNSQIDIQKQKIAALVAEKENIIAKMEAEGKSQEEIAQAIDSTNKQIEKEGKQLDKLNKELSRTNTALDKFDKEQEETLTTADKLRRTVEKQEKTLADLKEEYLNVSLEQGKSSKEAKKLANQINQLNGELDENKAKLGEVDDASDSANKGFLNINNGALAAVAGIAAIAAAAASAVSSFLGLAESTREFREDQAKLQSAFQTSGFSAEEASGIYQDFYSILGEEDRAVEAANHIAELADNEEDLAQWGTIATGVLAKFGDSLPIESLTEAANETAKTGKITGSLADALNWAGLSEEEFQKQLDACNTEQERATLITNTLESAYLDEAEAFRTLNGDVISARESIAAMTQAQAGLGAIAEPITTMFRSMGADILTSITPALGTITNGFIGAMTGVEGSGEQMSKGMTSLFEDVAEQAGEILPTMAGSLTGLISALLVGVANALPEILQVVIDTMLSIVNAISANLPAVLLAITNMIPQIITTLVAAVPQLLQAAITLLMAIVNAIPVIIPTLIAALPQVITAIVDALITAIPVLLEGAIQLLNAIVQAIPTILPVLIATLPTIINTIVNALIIGLPMILEGAIQLFLAIVNAIPQILPTLMSAMPAIITTIVRALVENIPLLLQTAFDLFMAIVEAIPEMIGELVGVLPDIITAIVDGLSEGFDDIYDVGVEMIEGLWGGIKSMSGWVISKIQGFCSDALGAVKDFFGIASPSKVMADDVGKNMALGIGEGFSDTMKKVNKTILENLPDTDLDFNLKNNVDRVNNQEKKRSSGMSFWQRPEESKNVKITQYITNTAATSRLQLWQNRVATENAVNLGLQTI